MAGKINSKIFMLSWTRRQVGRSSSSSTEHCCTLLPSLTSHSIDSDGEEAVVDGGEERRMARMAPMGICCCCYFGAIPEHVKHGKNIILWPFFFVNFLQINAPIVPPSLVPPKPLSILAHFLSHCFWVVCNGFGRPPFYIKRGKSKPNYRRVTILVPLPTMIHSLTWGVCLPSSPLSWEIMPYQVWMVEVCETVVVVITYNVHYWPYFLAFKSSSHSSALRAFLFRLLS